MWWFDTVSGVGCYCGDTMTEKDKRIGMKDYNKGLMNEVLFCIISINSTETPFCRDKQRTYDSDFAVRTAGVNKITICEDFT